MTVNYNVTGTKRKELVQLIANFTGCSAKYQGAPTFAYEVDYFTIDKIYYIVYCNYLIINEKKFFNTF